MTHFVVLIVAGAAALVCLLVGLALNLSELALVAIPAGAFFLVFIAAVLFESQYAVCKEEHDRAEALGRENVELLEKRVRFWEPNMRHDALLGAVYHYSTAIKNISQTRTVRNCTVSWAEPGGNQIPNTPAVLHRSGRAGHTMPASIDLNPGQVEVFDYLRIDKNTGQWDIPVSWDPYGQKIQPGSYEICLRVVGEDVPPQEQVIVIKPLDGGKRASVSVKCGDSMRPLN
jgi:hypothetical protein